MAELRRHHRVMRGVQLFWFAWSGAFFVWELMIVAAISLDGRSPWRFGFHLAALALQVGSLRLAARSWANTTAVLDEALAIETERARRQALG